MTKALTMCMIFMKSSHEMEKVPEAELVVIKLLHQH